MGLQIIGNRNQIVSAINSFNPSYHADYFGVRCLAKTYLATTPSLRTASPLAVAIHDVLWRWGAERRGAPKRRSVADVSTALMDQEMHVRLNKFANETLTVLNVDDAGNRVIRAGGGFASPDQFDTNLLGTLNALAGRLFSNNTNVTYPMKALLLITGFMPAFDGQVKKGLNRAGLTGVNKNQYLLPRDTLLADGKKICAMPFYMAQCYKNHSALIEQSITESSYPGLIGEIGRVFDVLLFVQQNPSQPRLLAFQPPNDRWYSMVSG
jgi:hypothetical protein